MLVGSVDDGRCRFRNVGASGGWVIIRDLSGERPEVVARLRVSVSAGSTSFLRVVVDP